MDKANSKANSTASSTVRFLTLNEVPQALDLIDMFNRTPAPRPSQSKIEATYAAITANQGGVIGLFNEGLSEEPKLIATCTLNVCANLSWSARPYAIIENVITHPDHRGKGHGKTLLNFATQHAQSIGCYKVALMTGSQKPSTLAFYEAAGFEQSKTGFQIRFSA